MKKFVFQTKEAFDFALYFSKLSIEERFLEFGRYLLSENLIRAVNGIVGLISDVAKNHGLEESAHSEIYRIGEKKLIEVNTELATELKKYEKETGVNMQDMLDYNAKFAYQIQKII